jgi:colanic acid/amylovoran biosynthesis protein
MKQTLKKLAGRVVGSPWYLTASSAVDILVGVPLAKLSNGRRNSEAQGHLLIPPLGRGNIGDQAMLDAFLENVPGTVTVVLARLGDLTIRPTAQDRVQVLEIPQLFSVAGRIRARIVLLRCLVQSSTLSVVGADIMDGGYSRRISMLRISMLNLARIVGVPSQVLGFSWKESADEVVARAMKEVSVHARLIVRDPISLQRMRKSGIHRAVQGADLVFAATEAAEASDIALWLEPRKSRPTIILNFSGLINRTVNLDDDYSKLIRWARLRGLAVIVLPHVIRTGDDDREVSRRIRNEGLWDDDILFVDRQLSPQEVSWLVSRVHTVVTGRMHLAIMALRSGKPAYVLATQGKVEGLMSLFASPEFVVNPIPGFADYLTDRLEAWSVEREAKLESSVARCTELAQQNFILTRQRPLGDESLSELSGINRGTDGRF